MNSYLDNLPVLKDDRSSAFLGSAISLSCYQLVKSIDEEMSEDFLSLFQADLELYQEEVLKENHLDENQIKQYLSLYPICIDDLKFVLSLQTIGPLKNIILLNDKMIRSLFSLTKSLLQEKRNLKFVFQENNLFIKNKRRYLIFLDDDFLYQIAEPIIAVSIKLLNRKQKGKKPFPDSFSIPDVITSLLHIETLKKIKKEDCDHLSSLFASCIREIKMQSLKDDYRYLSDFYHFLGCVIGGLE